MSTEENLSKYFHLSLNDAAGAMGICPTQLKKICRNQGIERWPHRKIKSIDELIEAVQYFDNIKFKLDVETLKEKRQYLLNNPNVPFREVIPKYISNCLKNQIEKCKEAETSSACSKSLSVENEKQMINHNFSTKIPLNIETPKCTNNNFLKDYKSTQDFNHFQEKMKPQNEDVELIQYFGNSQFRSPSFEASANSLVFDFEKQITYSRLSF